jgi:hypothetical protein
MSPKTVLTCFDNHGILHSCDPLSGFRPACFRMLFRVPLGISMLSLPATVTVPDF